MTSAIRSAIAAAAMIGLLSSAQAQTSCDSPRVAAALQDQIRTIAMTNANFLVRLGLWVPYFRIKEVEMSVVSSVTKGQARTGLECEIRFRMVPPVDLKAHANTIIGTFRFVLIPKSDENFIIDLY